MPDPTAEKPESIKNYTINKPCRPDGIYRKDGEVNLTQRQAKYLVMSGHLTPENRGSKLRIEKPVKTRKADE